MVRFQSIFQQQVFKKHLRSIVRVKIELSEQAVMPYRGLYVGFPTIYNPIGAIPPPATNNTRINQIEVAVSRY